MLIDESQQLIAAQGKYCLTQTKLSGRETEKYARYRTAPTNDIASAATKQTDMFVSDENKSHAR